jgi:hypothetical protein
MDMQVLCNLLAALTHTTAASAAVQAFLAASGSQLTKMNMQDLCNVLAAVTPLKLLPDQDWVDTLCRWERHSGLLLVDN